MLGCEALLFCIISVVSVFGDTVVFVSNSTRGHDTENADMRQCGSSSLPCKSLQKALSLVSKRGQIYLDGGDEKKRYYAWMRTSKHFNITSLRMLKWNSSAHNPTIISTNEDDSDSFPLFGVGLRILKIDSVDIVGSPIFSNYTQHPWPISIVLTNSSISNVRTVFNFMGTLPYQRELKINNTSFINCQKVVNFVAENEFVLHISHTKFIGPKIYHKQFYGIYMECYAPQCNVTIQDSIFDGISSSVIMNKADAANINLNIADCKFLHVTQFNSSDDRCFFSNIDVYGRGANVFITGSLFLNNTAWNGAALNIGEVHSVTITKSNFISNCAANAGGACYFRENILPVVVNECNFVNNTVKWVENKNFYSFQQGRSHHDGGAIVNCGEINIVSSLFLNNRADSFGGAIKHGNVRETKTMTIVNSTFDTNDSSALSGDLIYSLADLVLENVTISITGITVDNVIFYQTLAGQVTLRKNFHIQCPPNNRIRQKSTVSFANATQIIHSMLMYYCMPCPKDTYNLSGGYDHYMPSESGQRKAIVDIQCSKCPEGVCCDHNTDVKSNDNFWSKVLENGRLDPYICPENKCCSIHGKPCTKYNSCNFNREGNMCGKCVDGYAESMMPVGCIVCTKERQVSTWFLLIAKTLFPLFLLYMKNFIGCIKKWIIMNILAVFFCKKDKQDSELDKSQYQTIDGSEEFIMTPPDDVGSTNLPPPDDVGHSNLPPSVDEGRTNLSLSVDEGRSNLSPDAEMCTNFPPSDDEGRTNKTVNEPNHKVDWMHILQQIYFFYELIFALQINTPHRQLDDLKKLGVYKYIMKFVMGTTMAHKEMDFGLCLFKNADARINEVCILATAYVAISLVTVMCFVKDYLRYRKGEEFRKGTGAFNMYSKLIQFYILLHIPIIKSLYKLTHEAKKFPGNLQIDPNIALPMPGLVSFTTVCVSIMPVQMLLTSYLLEQRQIGIKFAVLSTVWYPLGIIIYPWFAYYSISKISKRCINNNNNDNNNNDNELKPLEHAESNEEIEYIVYDVFGHLRDSGRETHSKLGKMREFFRRPGLVWVLLRNVVITAVKLFVDDPMVKVYDVVLLLSFFILVFYLIKLWPDFPNEIVFLFTNLSLCYIGTMNIFWSFDFMSDLTYTSGLKMIGVVFLGIKVLFWTPVIVVLALILLFAGLLLILLAIKMVFFLLFFVKNLVIVPASVTEE